MISGTGNVAPVTYSSFGFFGLTAISGSPMVRMLPFPVRFISNLPDGPAEAAGAALPAGASCAEADIVPSISATTAKHAIAIDRRARPRRTCMTPNRDI